MGLRRVNAKRPPPSVLREEAFWLLVGLLEDELFRVEIAANCGCCMFTAYDVFTHLAYGIPSVGDGAEDFMRDELFDCTHVGGNIVIEEPSACLFKVGPCGHDMRQLPSVQVLKSALSNHACCVILQCI